MNVRHQKRFTIVGNHLAQHTEMSLVAMGLALHIQSLPAGHRIGIKDLAERFPESEYRIAEALRELEKYGYLMRTRVRLDNGQVVTRTVSYNRPRFLGEEPPEAGEDDAGADAGGGAPPGERSGGAPVRAAGAHVAAVEPLPRPAEEVVSVVRPLPRPAEEGSPARREAAARILVALRAVDPRLLLGTRDIERFVPATEAWLERGAAPDAVIAALSGDLPPHPRNPAGLVAYRLAVRIPPERVPAAAGPFPVRPPGPEPLRNCDHCDRAYRGPEPGCCDGCRSSGAA
ncbi:helix-turn-helix domain-containing protein [Streptomyces sp. NPDC006529]|uniref:helix-turn-helix domain-containing protein n=1 Tax=Streptomyces sp. NPDC006529 TaxID=3157177 RepID=UPI0033B09AD3